MSIQRKIFGEANNAVTSMASMPTWFDHKGRKMIGVGLCLHTRREVLRQLLPQYRQAISAQKRSILDEFTQLTGYHRKYAM